MRHAGSQQWDNIQSVLKPEGLFGKVGTLVVVHSMPAVYMSTGVSSCLSCIKPMRDKVCESHVFSCFCVLWLTACCFAWLNEQMGFGRNPQEQGRYFQMLEDWKHSGNREILIIAGDLHFGIETDIVVKIFIHIFFALFILCCVCSLSFFCLNLFSILG